MLFSIVVPVYNVEAYLDECIQSILSQIETIKNDLEVLLIDDGSTDRSGEVCDYYNEKFPDIVKVFHKKNEGLLATRRYGFKKATGDYIVNCDSDDLLENGMLDAVRNVIVKYNYPDIILINYNTYDGKTKRIAFENIFSNEKDGAVSKDAVLCEYMLGHRIVSLCGKIIKRSCINIEWDYREYGNLSTGEDTLQSIEFFINSDTFVYLNKALYNYRYGSGMTAKFDSNYYFAFKKILQEIWNKRQNFNIRNFDELFAIKVLQTAGRAITQSRYHKWGALEEHKSYLKKIRNDSMWKTNYSYIGKIKNNLQLDHYILLRLLQYRLYTLIIFLLKVKNIIG